MKHSEWLIVGAKVAELWPNQSWPPATMAAAYELFVAIEQAPAMQAVAELSAEGREFSPAPGVVLARTLQIVVASTPQLQDPDLTRDLTPEEQERAKRMSASLTGNRARLVQATWLVFAQHARIALAPGESAELAADRIKACDGRCVAVADRVGRSGMRSREIGPWLDECCVTGRPLFELWREAVFEMQAAVMGSMQQEMPA